MTEEKEYGGIVCVALWAAVYLMVALPLVAMVFAPSPYPAMMKLAAQ